jgi:hypothetical protein
LNVLPIDLTAIVAIIMGMLVVLIPVAGLTLRFALKPTVEAFARLFEHRGVEEQVSILERRMGLLESQMESVETSVSRIADALEFDRELGAERARPSLPASEERV